MSLEDYPEWEFWQCSNDLITLWKNFCNWFKAFSRLPKLIQTVLKISKDYPKALKGFKNWRGAWKKAPSDFWSFENNFENLQNITLTHKSHIVLEFIQFAVNVNHWQQIKLFLASQEEKHQLLFPSKIMSDCLAMGPWQW